MNSASFDQTAYLGRSSGAADPARIPVWKCLMLFILGASWGLQFTLLKVATDAQLGECAILMVSMFLLAACCLCVLAWQRAWFRPTPRHLRFFFLSSLFGLVFPLGAITLAANYLSAGLIVLFESMTPVFTVAIVSALRTEPVSPERRVALVLGIVSVLIVGGQQISSSEICSLTGLLLALIVPLVYAIDGIYVASCRPSDLRITQVVTGEAMAGTLILLPFFVWSGERLPPLENWGQGHWALTVFVLISLFEMFLYFGLLKIAGPLYVSMASFLSLLAGLGWGMVLLGETYSPYVWLAVGLVFISLYLVTVKGLSIA